MIEMSSQNLECSLPTSGWENENIHTAAAEIVSIHLGFLILCECLNEGVFDFDQPIILIDDTSRFELDDDCVPHREARNRPWTPNQPIVDAPKVMPKLADARDSGDTVPSRMLLTTLPLLLRESLADFGLEAVDRWWTELKEPARKDVIQLWEEANLSGHAEAYVEARAAEEEATDYNPALWHNDFYEYLVAHEVEYMPTRTFHICTRHPVARAAVQRGWIPADFVCPWEEGDGACPMRTILQRSAGRGVRLQIAWR